MTGPTLRRWLWVHKWTSLICTLFLLLICISGLPLVFRDEIGDQQDDGLPYASVGLDARSVNLDEVVATSRKMYPGETIVSAFVDDDEPRIMVFMAPSWEAFNADRKSMHWIRFDSHAAKVLKQSKPSDQDGARSST
ncbi:MULTISPECIES: PepSY domain-containing protein [unclassified Bradyrhizobium]|uniref:PepSY domain-containing protein n=1 Tax=Bradyrhizobium sp. U87765 SZCCT0134 TaxID=2807660 RepID=UPI0020123A22|nr:MULTISPECIES: PepSY domain-containing protein [unclassified Bradyrhizobium]